MPFELFSSKRQNDKDLVEIFSGIGKFLKKGFSPAKPNSSKIVDKERESKPDFIHGQTTFGVVYANDLAKAEIEKENPQFPFGSIIVREKHLSETSESPEIVIAMVKREKGFNKKSGDWEFFTFNGADLKMQKRETVGECAKCHMQAEKTDWVFRDYLQNFKVE